VQNLFPKIRRILLKALVPEIYWPIKVDLDGVQVPVRGMPLNFGTKYWLKKGEYEQDERHLITKALRPGLKVLEMGGSIGVLAQIIGEKVGPKGRVLSFEASERLVEISTEMWPPMPQLQRVKGFVFPVNNGENIFVGEFQTEGSELDGRGIWELRDGMPGNTWDLRSIRKEFNFDPEILIVDIEGGESIFDAIPPDFPDNLQSVIMEFHPHIYGIDGQARLEEKIIECGFSLVDRSGQCVLFVRT